jgi:hypothetical protein
MKFLQTIAVASFLTITAAANAGLHSFEVVNPDTGGQVPGQPITKIATTFDNANQRFTWETSLAADANVDGFWLVVNNGPNPKNADVNELAIMYGDLKTNTLSTYVYNGQNNANSIINPVILLQTDNLTTTAGGFSLDISTALINSWMPLNLDYTGIAFDDKLGIWFHYSTGSEFSFDHLGNITGYDFAKQGHYDKSHLTTTNVSAPSLIALFGLAFAGLTMVRRKTSQLI